MNEKTFICNICEMSSNNKDKNEHHLIPQCYFSQKNGNKYTIPLCKSCHTRVHNLKISTSSLIEDWVNSWSTLEKNQKLTFLWMVSKTLIDEVKIRRLIDEKAMEISNVNIEDLEYEVKVKEMELILYREMQDLLYVKMDQFRTERKGGGFLSDNFGLKQFCYQHNIEESYADD